MERVNGIKKIYSVVGMTLALVVKVNLKIFIDTVIKIFT